MAEYCQWDPSKHNGKPCPHHHISMRGGDYYFGNTKISEEDFNKLRQTHEEQFDENEVDTSGFKKIKGEHSISEDIAKCNLNRKKHIEESYEILKNNPNATNLPRHNCQKCCIAWYCRNVLGLDVVAKGYRPEGTAEEPNIWSIFDVKHPDDYEVSMWAHDIIQMGYSSIRKYVYDVVRHTPNATFLIHVQYKESSHVFLVTTDKNGKPKTLEPQDNSYDAEDDWRGISTAKPKRNLFGKRTGSAVFVLRIDDKKIKDNVDLSRYVEDAPNED